jgi:diaminopimelate decarboxylase
MLTKSMTVKNNELYLQNHSLIEIAMRYQTPLFVYDEESIVNQINFIKNHFTSKTIQTKIIYASKAFLCKYMVKLVQANDLLIDVVSMGEAHIVFSAGFNPKNVVFHGNNKSDAELKYAIEKGIGLVVVDNLLELVKLQEFASASNKKVNTLLRVNPGIEAHTHEYVQTSLLSSKFGESIFDQLKLQSIMSQYQKSTHVDLVGFHIHIGSQITSDEPYKKAVGVMMDFSKKIQQEYGIQVTTINFGGGFGIRYTEADPEYDLGELLKSMVQEVEILNKQNNVGISIIMIEPGRVIIGPNGVTLYQTSQIKNTFGGKNYCFIDGGMADNIRPALYQAKYTIKVADQYVATNEIKVDVVGKCCESGDIIAKDVMLPSNTHEDIVVVFATGAYGYSMSSNYNGLPRPAVVFVQKDQINVAIERETLEYITK